MSDHKDGKKYYKRKTSKNNYTVPQMMVPVYPQPMIYQNQFVAQPQPMFQMMPQTYGMVQPVIPQVAQTPMIAVPVGTPITVAQPVGTPILMPVRTIPTQTKTKTLKTNSKPIKKEPKNKAPNVIVKKYSHKQQKDDCCNIF